MPADSKIYTKDIGLIREVSLEILTYRRKITTGIPTTVCVIIKVNYEKQTAKEKIHGNVIN